MEDGEIAGTVLGNCNEIRSSLSARLCCAVIKLTAALAPPQPPTCSTGDNESPLAFGRGKTEAEFQSNLWRIGKKRTNNWVTPGLDFQSSAALRSAPDPQLQIKQSHKMQNSLC